MSNRNRSFSDAKTLKMSEMFIYLELQLSILFSELMTFNNPSIL